MAKSRRKKTEQQTVQPLAAASQDAGNTTAANGDRDRIASRAYELYLQRGGADGRALDDWLDAERELASTGAQRDRQS